MPNGSFNKAGQTGADQPAAAPEAKSEAKSEVKEKLKSESEGCPK